MSPNNLSWKCSHSLRLTVCPGTLLGMCKLWFVALLFLWGKCKFDFITFLSSLDLRFLLIETFEDWSPAGFIKPQKTNLKLNSATLQDSSSLNLITLMVIDSWAVLLQDSSVFLPLISVQNGKEKGGGKQTDERSWDWFCLLYKYPCRRVLHFRHVSLHRRLWSLSQWLSGCQLCTKNGKILLLSRWKKKS